MILKIQKYLTDFSNGILAILKVVLLSRFKTEIKYVRKDKPCIILGNGPSLEMMLSQNSDFLKNKDLICVNHFPGTKFYEDLKPKYYVTSAPDLWLEKIDRKFIDQSRKLFSDMATKTTWPVNFIVPFEAFKYRNWKREIEKNELIRLIGFNNIGVEGWTKLRHFLYRKNLAMPRPHNVIISALYVAINMGYKEIHIWGAEHTQFKEIIVDEKNNALINQKHFYDQDKSIPSTLDKRGEGQRKVHEILYKFMVAFRSYFVIQEYAKQRDVRILNATPGSLIDAFERIKYKN